jgi:L-ascorbate metabolism protein UlaG (beta-lactamase superfamily)
VTWLGHATVLVEMGGLRLLTDPVLGPRVGLLRRVVAPPPAGSADRIDAVLLSHLHTDHADLPSLRRVGTTVPVLAPPGVAAWLRERGFGRVRELSVGQATVVEPVTVEATPAIHGGRRWPHAQAAGTAGFLVRGECCVYFAGDTDLFPDMASLAGRVDLALLPVWGWGTSLGPGHLDPGRAAEAAAIIRPGVAVPIHWGTLRPPWARRAGARLAKPARDFADEAARLAPDVEVRVLAPGERTPLMRRRLRARPQDCESGPEAR